MLLVRTAKQASVVGDTGLEPVTSSVSGKRASQTAPIARAVLLCFLWCGTADRAIRARWRRDLNPCRRLCRPLPRLSATPPEQASQVRLGETLRADDGIRTRDPHLGKVMRYQLRYVRTRTVRASSKSVSDR